MNIDIIGDGRVGRALALVLTSAGEPPRAVFARTDGRPPVGSIETTLFDAKALSPADIGIISVRDDQIAGVVKALEGSRNYNCVLHTSGALSAEVLADLRKDGTAVGALHPLVAVSDPVSGSKSFAGAHYCIDGDREACDAAREIVSLLGGKSFEIDAKKKALYHAAAVMSAGHAVALFATALDMLKKAGVPASEAENVLSPLLKSTVQNVLSTGSAAALTGPFARGDVGTVARDLEAVEANMDGETAAIFRLLGLRSIAIDGAGGSDERISAIRELLK